MLGRSSPRPTLGRRPSARCDAPASKRAPCGRPPARRPAGNRCRTSPDARQRPRTPSASRLSPKIGARRSAMLSSVLHMSLRPSSHAHGGRSRRRPRSTGRVYRLCVTPRGASAQCGCVRTLPQARRGDIGAAYASQSSPQVLRARPAATIAQLRACSASPNRVVTTRGRTVRCCSRRTRGRKASQVPCP
jgi:hypothetical protein